MDGEHSAGDQLDADELLQQVYGQLRDLAARHLRRQRSDHTLQPTALVHEAYLKLARADARWNDEQHFFAVAATAMRQILLNHAQAKRAAKRNANRVDITLGQFGASASSSVELLALDAALSKLEALDARFARLVELRFFGGLTMDQVATQLGVARSTVQEDWRYVRAWLARELGVESGE